MILEDDHQKEQETPKPPQPKELEQKIKEIPNPAFFPSTPNTPKKIEIEKKSEQLKNAKPNEGLRQQNTTSTRVNVMEPMPIESLSFRAKENFSTRAHLLSSSQSSLISFNGCILHDQKSYDEKLAHIKKNIAENQSIIHQTNQALSIAYVQNKTKNYISKEMIEAERLALLACIV